MTERQTEELLQYETRTLTLPDGRSHAVTVFKLCWDCYDLIIATGCFTGPRLIDIAYRQAERQGWSFKDSFQCIVAYTFRKIKYS